MAHTPLVIPPGVVTDSPANAASGRWIASNRVSFRDGALQNMRGWAKAFSDPAQGVPRAAVRWTLLTGGSVTAVGTHRKLNIFQGGKRYDITPIRSSGTLGANPFATSSGSSVVTVTHTAHAAQAGDTVTFSGATTVGGLSMNGEWVVSEVISTSSYRVTLASSASSSATGGGSGVTYAYEIYAGSEDSEAGAGWGTGAWGEGTWGTPHQSDVLVPARTWWLAPWGEDLIACHTNGSIYWWDATNGVQTRATLLSGAPTNNAGVLVSDEDRHIIVIGAGGDPLAVQWPNQGSLTDWTPSATSTADTRRILHGSVLVSAIKSGSETLLLTDESIYSLRYTGGTVTSHSLTRIPGSISIMSAHAIAQHSDAVYWMGNGQFYAYDGRVQIIPCPLANTLRSMMNVRQASKIIAGANYVTGEIIWFWPAGNENDHYIKFSLIDRAWDMGELARTAWFERGESANPIGLHPNGTIYEHESTTVTQAVNVTLRCRKYNSSTPVDFGPFTITPDTHYIRPHARGRYVSMLLEGTIDGDGQPEPWSAETGPFSIGDGDEVMFVDRIVPDVKFLPHVVRIGAFSFAARSDGQQ